MMWTRQRRARAVGALAMLAAMALAGRAAAEVAPDGSVTLQGVTVPLSDRMSAEARDYMRRLLVERPFAGGPSAAQDIAGYRAHQDKIMGTFLEPMRRRYAVRVEEARLSGVLTDIVTPAEGVAPENADRVLLNIHGGGFISGARTAALVESIPIAARMRIKVISVDYQLSPEVKFPAASEDIAAVYAELLKTYRPSQIGIYGCSAGGMLVGQAVVGFQERGLPRPAAIGVLCASLGQLVSGDAAHLSGPLNGFPAAPSGRRRPSFGYMSDVSPTDPRGYPEASPQMLASFPPTLLMTGTRSMEFSAAAHSHNQLVKANIEAELHVWDGMFHGFFYNSELPESQEAYDVIARFFDKHLARRP